MRFRSTNILTGDLSCFGLSTEEHIFVTVQHHIVSDGWSIRILLHELKLLYSAFVQGLKSPLRDLPIQYGDYARWQRSRLQGDAMRTLLQWWRKHLEGCSFVLDLPTDLPRPELQSEHGDWEAISIGPAHCKQLKAFCSAQGVTPFMVMLTVYAIFLSRYSGQKTLVLATPTGNREQPECEDLLGFFINTLAIRIDYSGAISFADAVQATKRETIEAFAHQELPFERLVEEVQPTRDLSRSPVAQVMFIMHSQPSSQFEMQDITVGAVNYDTGTSKYELTLTARLSESELILSLEYCTALFEQATIRRMLRQIRELLISALTQPDLPTCRLSMGDESEAPVSTRSLGLDNASLARTITDLVRDASLGSPQRIAVVDQTRTYTYFELHQLVGLMHERLTRMGVKCGDRIAVNLDHSIEMVATLLAVLRLGAAYVPVDDSSPKERLRRMLDDAGVVVYATDKVTDDLPLTEHERVLQIDRASSVTFENGEDMPLVDHSHPSDMAYILYTSGSTGEPKGVAVSNVAVVNFLCSMRQSPGISSTDRILALTSLTFDISVLEIFLPLISGATLVLGDAQLRTDGRSLARFLEAAQITIMQATPTGWSLLLANDWQGKRDLKALCGGEPMPRQLARGLLQRVGCLWNLYGPTETTVWSSLQRIDSARSNPSIGFPIANTQMYCLDDDLSPTPIGIPGEIYIAGAGLAEGYFNDPRRTAASFIPNPFAGAKGERMYRTGDWGRRIGNGQFQFLRRIDRQVKLRGHRIELSEIEHVLVQHSAIQHAIVQPAADDRSLLAWIVVEAGQQLNVEKLRTHLAKHLPHSMIPGKYIQIDALPVLSSGKLDRAKLRDLDDQRVGVVSSQPPSTSVQKRVAAIWNRLLGTSHGGIHDNFFDLGGHSLLLASVREEMRHEFGFEIPMIDMFRYPTIGSLANSLTELEKTGA
ncbi:MAG: amino acid adenylation domain-containing protein [Pirellulaceae bacterium]